MDFKLLRQLYWAFLRIGGLTFGGGLTMLPMLKYELVEKKDWITEDELLDCYAIGQCTPGIIAVNTATYVGYKKAGIMGGIFSTLGIVTPSLVIITLVAACLEQFMDNIWLQHALMGVRGIVCALMLNTVLNLAKKSLTGLFSYVICIVVFLVALFTGIPTILIVFVTALLGIFLEMFSGKKVAAKEDQTGGGK
ncbi:MAG: chromate transporter [Lachnospiraceae bacterium]